MHLCNILLYYIDTDKIPGFLLLLKNHIFTARSEDTIFIFHMWGHWCRKYFSLVRLAHSWEIHAALVLEDKIRVPARPCNILSWYPTHNTYTVSWVFTILLWIEVGRHKYLICCTCPPPWHSKSCKTHKLLQVVPHGTLMNTFTTEQINSRSIFQKATLTR